MSALNNLKNLAVGRNRTVSVSSAAIAYRRCKVGMRDEDYAASLVIGQTGLEVTAVFAQAPGALELLPTQQYDSSWLRVKDLAGNDLLPPHPDPYDGIYAVPTRRLPVPASVSKA